MNFIFRANLVLLYRCISLPRFHKHIKVKGQIKYYITPFETVFELTLVHSIVQRTFGIPTAVKMSYCSWGLGFQNEHTTSIPSSEIFMSTNMSTRCYNPERPTATIFRIPKVYKNLLLLRIFRWQSQTFKKPVIRILDQAASSQRVPRVTWLWLTFVFSKSRVQISTWTPAIPTEVLRGFPQTLQAIFARVIQIRTRQIPSTSSPICY
jgi:hypothetical protein